MNEYPQVALFGSMAGSWRERDVIPLLERLGVSYFDPNLGQDWTPEMGKHEAEVMARCETIVMVINSSGPSFTGLAETGWAALGALQRGQHFILQVDIGYQIRLPESLRGDEEGLKIEELMNHWIRSSRYLVTKHAREFSIPSMHVVNDMEGVLAALRAIYEVRGTGTPQ